MARDTVLAAAESELQAAGIRYSVVSSGKHHKVLFNVAGKPCMVVLAKTTSDHRAHKNARSLVRRTIKQALND